MQLSEYLNRQQMTLREMAEKIGATHPSLVHRHASGKSVPDALTQERYRHATDGRVTPQDWINLSLKVAVPQKKKRPPKVRVPEMAA